MEGVVPLPLMSVFITYLAKNKSKHTEIAKSSIYLWLLGNFVKSLAVNRSVNKGK
jgi:hypothetical protein